MRVGRVPLLILALLVASLAIPPSPALANDFIAQLWSGDLGQRGELYAMRDTDCGPSDCVTSQLIPGPPRFPEEALRLGPGTHRAHVRFRTESARPKTSLRYWTEVDAEGAPVGRPALLPHSLHARKGPRWVVRFQSPALPPDAYLGLKARWPAPLGRDDYAAWGFHLAE